LLLKDLIHNGVTRGMQYVNSAD